jgi:hypothetical protein
MSFPGLAAPELISGALAQLLLLLPRTRCLGSSCCQRHPLPVLLLLIAQATGLRDSTPCNQAKYIEERMINLMVSKMCCNQKQTCRNLNLTFFCFTAALATYAPLSSLPAFTIANLSSFDIFLLT